MADRHVQLQLFPPEFREQHPGDLTPNEWASQDGRVFHGTRGTFDPEGRTVHAGSLEAAVQLSASTRGVFGFRSAVGGQKSDARDVSFTKPSRVHRDGDGDPDRVWRDREDSAPVHYARPDATGEVYALQPRSVSNTISDVVGQTLGDRPGAQNNPAVRLRREDFAANRAHVLRAADTGERVANSVWNSQADDSAESWAWPREMSPGQFFDQLTGELASGRTLAYGNANEDRGSTAYVIPPGGARTWEHDVLESPNVGEYTKAGIRDLVSRGQHQPVTLEYEEPVAKQPQLPMRQWDSMSGDWLRPPREALHPEASTETVRRRFSPERLEGDFGEQKYGARLAT